MLAAHLNELGVSSQQPSSQPEAPPRSNRSQQQQLPTAKAPSSVATGLQNVANNNINNNNSSSNNNNNGNHQQINPLDPIESSDTDSEPDEPNDSTRNDGTLLASDPPKPL